MIVSTEPDKVRGIFQSISFEISPERDVRQLDEFLDVRSEQQQREQRAKDQEAIERNTEAIRLEKFKQCDIVEYCHGHGISKRQTPAVLKRYEGELWCKEKMFQNNAIAYYLK